MEDQLNKLTLGEYVKQTSTPRASSSGSDSSDDSVVTAIYSPLPSPSDPSAPPANPPPTAKSPTTTTTTTPSKDLPPPSPSPSSLPPSVTTPSRSVSAPLSLSHTGSSRVFTPPRGSRPPLPTVGELPLAEPFPDLAVERIPAPAPAAAPPRGRKRSNTLRGTTSPIEEPLSAEEQRLSSLAQAINRDNRRAETARNRAALVQSGGYRGTVLTRGPSPPNRDRSRTPTPRDFRRAAPTEDETQTTPGQDEQDTSRFTRAPRNPQIRIIKLPPGFPTDVFKSLQFFEAPSLFVVDQYKPSAIEVSRFLTSIIEKYTQGNLTTYGPLVSAAQEPIAKMNYNYNDNAQGGSNPRQAPPSPSPSPSQGLAHANGMNGGMAGGAALVGYPTPAGHQSDLNYVMAMVEELSGILRMNQQLTANVVDKMGKVREKAKHMDLSNDELIAVVAQEMNEESENLEKENSELRKAIETTDYNKKENWKLAIHGAEILADMAEKMHRFKENHEADTLAWHKNYRKQLADEREENLNLRNQINDMKAAACRASENLRLMRRFVADNDKWNELEIENNRLRTEKRFWKRMALPLIPDNDPEWSDDDDLIDPEEKKREAIKKEKERRDREEGGDELS